jgi:hypothetical protein
MQTRRVPLDLGTACRPGLELPQLQGSQMEPGKISDAVVFDILEPSTSVSASIPRLAIRACRLFRHLREATHQSFRRRVETQRR